VWARIPWCGKTANHQFLSEFDLELAPCIASNTCFNRRHPGHRFDGATQGKPQQSAGKTSGASADTHKVRITNAKERIE
jgi:hypothetical protein